MFEITIHSVMAWGSVFMIAFVTGIWAIYVQNARAQNKPTYTYLIMRLSAGGTFFSEMKEHRNFFPKSPLRTLTVVSWCLAMSLIILQVVLDYRH